MPPSLQLWDSTGSVQISAPISTGPIDGGTTLAAVDYWLYNDKGGSLGASKAVNLRLQPKFWDGSDKLDSGAPIVDERWMQIKVSGVDKTGDASMEDQSTGWVPVGAGAPLILKDISANCGRKLTVQVVVPAGATSATEEVFLDIYTSEASVAIPFRLGTVSGPGVIPDYLDVSARRLRRGRALSATGAATVTVGKGAYVFDGVPYNRLADVVTLNQNDGNAAALTAGNSYIAVLSQVSGAGVTATKGAQAAAPVAPAIPANQIYLGKVTVAYQGGGTSIINTGNLDTTSVTYGEYLVTAGAALTVRIGAGYALTSADMQPFLGSTATLAVTDNTTNYVWLRADGTFSATATNVAPSVGALLLASVVTVSGAVTSVTDLRTWVAREVRITLRYKGNPTATGNDIDWGILEADAYLEDWTLDLGSAGVGGSGNWKHDINSRPPGTPLATAGTTVFTSEGSSDQRPTMAANAASPRISGFDHEINSFVKGTRFSFDRDVVPSGFGTAPVDEVLVLRFWKK
ncbi:MAG TPA: hypothetical protein VLC46_16390 [Thermoanaerobaculia bacterium]|jgi:hypothetical protein|nr:hypothetical protein [Thermoanaerobaculia bacterium]